MSKSFISILGTNDYLECRHSFKETISDQPVKYAQEDLIKFFCQDFDYNDEIRIFLTKDATEKNWEDNGHKNRDGIIIPNKGLVHRLNDLKLKTSIVPFDIKEGFTETEIWQTFQTIYDTFIENEEVIVDITHSFRSLPMLMVTLLNFAKQVKKIKVKGIYYAAFESLGKIEEVRKLKPEERITPILELTAFADLQDWTNATYDFINSASVKSFKELIRDIQYRFGKSKENKLALSTLVNLNQIIDDFLLCRGNSIKEYNFAEIKESVLRLKESTLQINPLNLLIDKIYDKISKFEKKGIMNVLYAVEFCISHNFYQQAITLLQELIITVILLKLNKDEKNKDLRQVVSYAFYIKLKNINKSNWTELSKKHSNLTESLLSLSIIEDIKNDYEYLTNIRNDINHGGFSLDVKKSESIISRLNNSFVNIKPKLLNFI